MSSTARLVAVVPAYQAGTTIGEVVAGIQRHGLDVVVIDDGSVDATAERARAAGARLVRHHRNRGKGTALVTGFRWALDRGYEGVLTLDADAQHAAEDIPALIACSGEADLVIGRRRLDARHMPAGRLIGNRVSTFFISLFCGAALADTQCGFRLYSRRLLTELPLRGGHFETETELLMRAQLSGMRLCWVPVETIYPPAGASAPDGTALPTTHFDNLRDTLRIIRVVLASPRYPRQGP